MTDFHSSEFAQKMVTGALSSMNSATTFKNFQDETFLDETTLSAKEIFADIILRTICGRYFELC